MLTWLVENSSTLYLVLGTIALITAALWWRRRTRPLLIGLVIAVGLLAAVVVLDLLVPTDQKRIMSSIKAMDAGVATRNADQIFAHISESFRVKSYDKVGFRYRAEPYLPQVSNFKVWDFQPQQISREGRTGTIHFLVRADSPAERPLFFRCLATFALDADGQWRLRTFELFDPLADPARASPVEMPF
jgi:hypothetical protein